jgi:hypothetical protein
MLGCLGKVPPDRSQGHVTDYIIQHYWTQMHGILGLEKDLGFADFAGSPIGEGVEGGSAPPLPKKTPTPIVMAWLKARSKDPPLKTRGGTDRLNGGGWGPQYPYVIS